MNQLHGSERFSEQCGPMRLLPELIQRIPASQTQVQTLSEILWNERALEKIPLSSNVLPASLRATCKSQPKEYSGAPRGLNNRRGQWLLAHKHRAISTPPSLASARLFGFSSASKSKCFIKREEVITAAPKPAEAQTMWD